MKATIRAQAAAAMLLLAPVAVTFVAQPVAAQAQPSITNMSLNSDHGLAPGATLRAQVQATPGGRNASVVLGNSGVSIPLREQSAGHYAGSYVVRQGQHVDPTQLMTPRIQYGGYIYSRNFYYPPSFQALAMGNASGSASAPRIAIERFNMRSEGDPSPGRELHFRLTGPAGAKASIDIPGVARDIALRESKPGVYTGTYVVRQRDDLDAFRRAVATLRKGEQSATARVDLRDWDEDNRAPRISIVTPEDGAKVSAAGRAHVAARLNDAGGVERARLLINGRDVTREARREGNELHYRADLAPGRYTAEVVARDASDNVSRRSWQFDVVAAASSEPPRLNVTSHSDRSVVDIGTNTVIQGRTAPWQEVRVRVQSTPNVTGPNAGTRTVYDDVVRADGDGRFTVTVDPSRDLPATPWGVRLPPGSRVDVQLSATNGGHTAEERFTLFQRG